MIFFLAALGADAYEHFLYASANNVFMVARGDWTVWFDASVFVLLGLEIIGCSLGVLLRGATFAARLKPCADERKELADRSEDRPLHRGRRRTG